MIRKFTLAALLGLALTAGAEVPFEPTTIIDGKVAPDTKWYTIQISATGNLMVPDNLQQDRISLTRCIPLGASNERWCFVGNETDGFTIINKKYGVGMPLAAPADPASAPYTDNGGDAFLCMKAPGAEGYAYLWDFSASDKIANKKGQFMSLHGNEKAAVNKRGDTVAFWTKGKDGGSTVVITPYEAELPNVSVSGDTAYIGESALTCPSGTATAADGTLTLGEGTWSLSGPEGQTAIGIYYTDANGESVQILGNFSQNTIKIQGPATLKDAVVECMESVDIPEYGFPVFISVGAPHPYFNVGYRIPSITSVEAGPHAGRIFAVNDYRYSGADIGSGRIDLYMSYSDDFGKTWTRPDHMRNAQGKPVAKGTGAPGSTLDNLDCGFGDPASVSDRETGEILVVSCCGRVGFWNGRRENPQPSARWWSKDGGETWTEPDYGQWEQIYALFDSTCVNGYIDSQFIGSGRMVQSKYIKVGTHYRVYAVMSGYHAASGNVSNWVLYSDDFGHNWHVLGDPMKPGVTEKGDEPKCEELPDGSVLLAARANGGNRHFNIFHYTDLEKAEGYWDSHVNTDMGMGFINACNGEIMILPVRNKATGEKCYMALQSFPYGGGRNNVSIAWKTLSSGADFSNPTAFTTWNGRYQVSKKPSAYSTMCFQKDNKIGFMFEEQTYTDWWTEIYSPLTIDTITSDQYEYFEDADQSVRNALVSDMMKNKTVTGKYVGQPAGASDEVRAIIDGYEANPSYDSVVSFNNAMLSGMNYILPEHGKFYRFTSAHDGTYANIKGDRYLSVSTSKSVTVAAKKNQYNIFQLEQIEGTEDFRIYSPEVECYLPVTASQTNTAMKAVQSDTEAGSFTFKSSPSGHTAIVCTNPGNAQYPAIHMAAGPKIVIWTEGATASKWYMEPVDPNEDSITEIGAAAPAGKVRIYDLQGREVKSPRRGNIYITSDHTKIRY